MNTREHAVKVSLNSDELARRQRKWFCAEHTHLAAPGDNEPYRGPRLAYGPGGAIVDLDERAFEAERQRVQAESRRRQREQKEAERRREAGRFRESEALRDASFRSEMPKGLRP